MKLKVCILMICLFAVAGLALAQAKVDGKWMAEIQGGERMPVEFMAMRAQ